MSRKHRQPLTDPKQVPEAMTEEEARAFWETHEVTEAYLSKAEVNEPEGLPKRTPTASQSINLRLEVSTLKRLKALAARKQMGYQTLLKSFLTERLYEEEKREGVL
jgi:predicted DNA binding CopG/RHH family protein